MAAPAGGLVSTSTLIDRICPARPDAGDAGDALGNHAVERERRPQGYVRASLQGVGGQERVGFHLPSPDPARQLQGHLGLRCLSREQE